MLAITSQTHSALLVSKHMLTCGADENACGYNQVIDSCTCWAKVVLKSLKRSKRAERRMCGLRRRDIAGELTRGFFACRSRSLDVSFWRFAFILFLSMGAWTYGECTKGMASARTEHSDGFSNTWSASSTCDRSVISCLGGVRVGRDARGSKKKGLVDELGKRMEHLWKKTEHLGKKEWR